MTTERTWEHWLTRLYNLRRDKSGLHERPHKPILLLAILNLLDRGTLTRNEIPLSPDLVKTFKRYFESVRQADDQPTIETPFYHLCGDGFWQLVSKPGERPLYEPGNASRGPTLTALREIHGRFDDSLWTALLTNAHLPTPTTRRPHRPLLPRARRPARRSRGPKARCPDRRCPARRTTGPGCRIPQDRPADLRLPLRGLRHPG